ncbi:MAG: linear amide C-N hydrolase [Bacteroidetes bacterium]|nr:linear amide C-N hydrolase [Bacteroidota bacterium]
MPKTPLRVILPLPFMHQTPLRAILPLLMVLLAGQTLLACSAAVLKTASRTCLIKNFDWTLGTGYLVTSPRGVARTAFPLRPGLPAQWTARYGSVTFTQNGLGMPYGGMNEAGLVVEMLWMEFTEFSPQSGKSYTNELEWIQRQLDRFGSVAEVLDSLDSHAVHAVKGKIHYILADASGASAVIEYVGGRARVLDAAAGECQSLTNYDVSFSEQQYREHGGRIPGKNSSHLHRYGTLRRHTESGTWTKPGHADRALSPVQANQTGFALLDQVALTKGLFRTRWSIVYDLDLGRLAFKTDENHTIKNVVLESLKPFFEHGQPPRFIALLAPDNRTASLSWKHLAESDNQALIAESFSNLGLGLVDASEWSLHQWAGLGGNGLLAPPENAYTRHYAELILHFNVDSGDLGFLQFAIMRTEEDYEQQRAVEGGAGGFRVRQPSYSWVYYGLRKGKYAIAAVQEGDRTRNRRIDFTPDGAALERYAISNGIRAEQGAFPPFDQWLVPVEDTVVPITLTLW